MGLACCMIIGSFCSLQGFLDCQIGCGLGIISGLSQLLTISYIQRDSVTPLLSIFFLLFLSYGIMFHFSPYTTDSMVFVINTLSCVMFPFDVADKLLRTKDPSYMHIPMHSLAFLSCLVWGLDYLVKGTTVLVIANLSGLLCEIVVFIAYLYAINSLDEGSPLVKFAQKWQKILYHIPCRALGFSPLIGE